MVTRLMITDDHALVRSALIQFMEMAPDIKVVGETSSGNELLDSLRTTQADVLLLDMVMPGISGEELIARVRSGYPNLHILVLSMHDSTRTVLRAMKAGASGYITKNANPATLLEAIHKIASTGKYLTPEMAEKLAFASSIPDVHGIELSLSEREMQIYPLIVEGKCIKTIANELSISDKTVSTHKAHILAKLGVKNVPELVRLTMQNNLTFD